MGVAQKVVVGDSDGTDACHPDVAAATAEFSPAFQGRDRLAGQQYLRRVSDDSKDDSFVADATNARDGAISGVKTPGYIHPTLRVDELCWRAFCAKRLK